jgi:hypothetical protein
MNFSNYLCAVVGESPERVARLHDSTRRRLKTFAIALHIPVTLWAAPRVRIVVASIEPRNWGRG